jgi:hypothetical protein
MHELLRWSIPDWHLRSNGYHRLQLWNLRHLQFRPVHCHAVLWTNGRSKHCLRNLHYMLKRTICVHCMLWALWHSERRLLFVRVPLRHLLWLDFRSVLCLRLWILSRFELLRSMLHLRFWHLCFNCLLRER